LAAETSETKGINFGSWN